MHFIQRELTCGMEQFNSDVEEHLALEKYFKVYC